MTDLVSHSKQQLIAKIHELEELLAAIKADKDAQELLNMPWVGNLGNWYWYVPSNRVVVNDMKLAALGLDPADVPAQIGFEYFTWRLHPDDYSGVMANMRAHLQGKTPAYEVEYRIKAESGQWVWFYDRGKVTKWDDAGRPEIVSGIVFNISEQKRLVEELAELNRQLVKLSATDELTKIYNRRRLFAELDHEMKRAARYGHPLCIVLFDIDHFKLINDTHGHLLGDKILVQVSEKITGMIRRTDIFGRFGGEEFLLVLPECSLKDAAAAAEKIRVGIAAGVYENGIKVTVSGGGAQIQVDDLEHLLEAADRCLYAAKQNGRNRVEFCSLQGE